MQRMTTFSIPEQALNDLVGEKPTALEKPESNLSNSLKAVAITYLETYFWRNNKYPSIAEVADFCDLSEQDATKLIVGFKDALDNRGLPAYFQENKGLDPKFVLYCNFAASVADKRSNAQKLKDAGLTANHLSAFLTLPIYKEYYDQTVSRAWSTAENAAKLALLRNVESGNLDSIKYSMEWQGKFSQASSSEVNLMLVIAALMEILAKHLQPQALEAVATEFDEVINKQLTKGLS